MCVCKSAITDIQRCLIGHQRW